MTQTPLSDLTVLDFSRVRAGPWCTQLLATMGAEVIKIERPGVGDMTRGSAPMQGGTGGNFISKNRNKRSVELDLKSEAGRELAEGLVADEVNPDLVYASITGYGHRGPDAGKKGVDLVMQAEGGIMSVTGPEGGPPVKVGQAIGDIGAGLYAVIAILAALHTDTGQKVETNLFGTIVSIMDEYITDYGITGEDPEPLGTRHQSGVPYELFETKDDHLVLSHMGGGWEPFVREIIGDESLLEYDTGAARQEHYDEIMAALRPKLREKTTAEWLEIAEDHDFVAGELKRVSEVVDQPQSAALGYVTRYEDDDLGEVLLPGYPLHFSAFDQAEEGGIPGLGEHTEAVLAEKLGLTPAEIEARRDDGAFG